MGEDTNITVFFCQNACVTQLITIAKNETKVKLNTSKLNEVGGECSKWASIHNQYEKIMVGSVSRGTVINGMFR